jgi:hypothetical protein
MQKQYQKVGATLGATVKKRIEKGNYNQMVILLVKGTLYHHFIIQRHSSKAANPNKIKVCGLFCV